MAFLIKTLLALFWLLILPFGAGNALPSSRKNPHPALCLMTGYIFMFALAEVLILFTLFLNIPLHTLTSLFAILMIALGILGILHTRSGLKGLQMPSRPSIWLILALILILLQIVYIVILGHLDADDALYVGAATTALESDSVYHVNAYTGLAYINLPRRYILSPFPIFLAMISQLSAGLHPAILAHTIMPLIFLPLVYVVMYLLALRWFPDKAESRGIFLLLVSVLFWFSAYSVYNSGDFTMVRIWQGKAFLCAIMLPLLFYLSLRLIIDECTEIPWLIYFLGNLSACLLSSMGIMLSPILMGCFSLIGLWKNKNFKRFFYCLLCTLPSVILGLAYLILKQ